MEDKGLRVFISQPMYNKTSEEIEANNQSILEKVKKYFNDDDIIDCDSYFDTKIKLDNVKNEPLYWLSQSIMLLSTADVIVMGSGWENSRGCIIEYECAKRYGMLVIYEDTDYITKDKLFEVDRDSTAIY